MNETLAHPYFREFIVPLITIFFTIAVKVVSRKDSFIGITRDDFAIGFDLIVTSIILLVTYYSGLATQIHNNIANNPELCRQKLEMFPWVLLFSICGLWSLSTIVRIYGWQNGQSKKLRIWPGVILPTFTGIIYLLIVINYIA
ncbi:MAG TPA: hypothetical protein VN721_00425 [Flavipsychrobacter sp.]|nr:hypothetical protein [Flavipsychrobacter sp.]